MQSNAPVRRNASSQQAARRRKQKQNRSIVLILLVFIAVFAVMYLVFPKQATPRALTSVAGDTSNGAENTAYYQGLIINEVMGANRTAVPDEKGEFNDWVELYNDSGHDIDMKNVGLSDRADSIRFLFPQFTLHAGEYVVVFASDTNAAEVGGTFHAKFKISSVGETIYLYDPSAYIIDQVTTPILSTDASWARDVSDAFSETAEYSPGYENTHEGFLAYRAVNAVSGGALIINEIMADPRSGLTDEDGELQDWVELYNTSDQTIKLSSYALSDKENKPLKWRFPEGAYIAPHGFYVVFCSGKDRAQTPSGIPHTNFRISAERETILLSDSYGRMVDRVSIDNLAEDCSFGRNESGGWQVFRVGTPGMTNNELGAAQADTMLRSLNPTGVYITEALASNSAIAAGSSQLLCDWVEIYNSTGSTVQLGGYGFSDNLNRPRKWQFPSGASIGPGEYKIIYLDGNAAASTAYEFHTSFKLARGGGETLTFADPTGKVLDRIYVPEQRTNVSYGRTSGLNGFFYYDAPTPGTANGTGFYGFAEAPSFSLDGGVYYKTIEVTINVPENATVYYTLNGAIPTRNSTLYNGEIFSVSRTTVLRACAFADNLKESQVATETYFVNVFHTMPVVSLVADPDVLYNPENGILTVGPNIDKSKGIPFKNAVYRTVKETMEPRPGSIEIYDTDGTTLVDQGIELSLQGQYSLDMPQKTFKVRAKAEFGAKYFEAALFPDRPFTQYKSLVLRNSGNDCVFTRLNDGLMSRLVDMLDTTVIHQAWRPVVVYLNGVYWGHYNLRERVDRYFVAQHEGLPLEEADNMDIVEASSKTVYGSNSEYKKLIAAAKKLSPNKNPEDLQYLLDRIDVDNYFDYMALEMFFGNSDPGNIRYYKLKREGSKWRWILYDMDWALFNSKFDSPKSYLKAKGAGQQNINNTLIVKLLENDEMRDKFLTRLGEVFQLYTTEVMIAKIDELAAILEPEMQMHFSRWAEENDKAINVDSPLTAAGALRYWNTRLDYTRNVCKKRPTYFYEFVQTQFKLTDAQMVSYFGEKPVMPADAKL